MEGALASATSFAEFELHEEYWLLVWHPITVRVDRGALRGAYELGESGAMLMKRLLALPAVALLTASIAVAVVARHAATPGPVYSILQLTSRLSHSFSAGTGRIVNVRVDAVSLLERPNVALFTQHLSRRNGYSIGSMHLAVFANPTNLAYL
jgi:hypothetical protein